MKRDDIGFAKSREKSTNQAMLGTAEAGQLGMFIIPSSLLPYMIKS